MSLLDQVDLNSYSSSVGYCGFFSYTGKDFKKGADFAIELVCSYFKSDQLSAEVFSSLRTSCSDSELRELYAYTAVEIEEFLLPAINCTPPILRRQEAEQEIFAHSLLSSVNEQALYGACYAVMALGGLRGHLFIYLKNSGVFLYPHDNVGFGLIATNYNRAQATGFLDYVSGSRFEVVKKLFF